jgi:hypothetical protein
MPFTPAQARAYRAYLRTEYKTHWQTVTNVLKEKITLINGTCDAANASSVIRGRPTRAVESVSFDLQNTNHELHLVAYLNNFGPRARFESFLAKYTESATEYATALEEVVHMGHKVLAIHNVDGVERVETGLNEATYKKKVDDKMKTLRMYQDWGDQYTARGLWRN